MAISDQIRSARFNILPKSEVHLEFESSLGDRYTSHVYNISLTGLSCTIELFAGVKSDLNEHELLSSGKLIFDNTEYPLGRLVLRRIEKTDNHLKLACSFVDIRAPLSGPLSKHLDNDSQIKNPYEFELSSDKFNLANFSQSQSLNYDLFQRTREFQIFFKDWLKSKKYGYRTIRLESQGNHVKLKKTRANLRNDFIMFGSNDYLGYASHPAVKEAAIKAIERYGFGSTGSAKSTGLTDIHQDLCELLAKTFNKDGAILFNSGYGVNIGVLSGLARETDLLVCDNLAHASLHDGLQMSRATSKLFKHNNMQHLEEVLNEHRDNYSSAMVITEGVFSMDGDTAPMGEIVRIAKKYNARTFLDEAHSFGVTGPTGLGCWETCPDQEVDMIMGTFSKICGGIGGWFAAEESVIDWLDCHARSYIFSVSIPPSTAAAALTAIKLFLSDRQILDQLRSNIKHFVTGLRTLGFDFNDDHPSTIVPVVIGDEKKLGLMHESLIDSGIWVVPVVYPAVSRTQSRFRFTVMATHSISDLDFAIEAIKSAMQKADFKPSKKID